MDEFPRREDGDSTLTKHKSINLQPIMDSNLTKAILISIVLTILLALFTWLTIITHGLSLVFVIGMFSFAGLVLLIYSILED